MIYAMEATSEDHENSPTRTYIPTFSFLPAFAAWCSLIVRAIIVAQFLDNNLAHVGPSAAALYSCHTSPTQTRGGDKTLALEVGVYLAGKNVRFTIRREETLSCARRELSNVENPVRFQFPFSRAPPPQNTFSPYFLAVR